MQGASCGLSSRRRLPPGNGQVRQPCPRQRTPRRLAAPQGARLTVKACCTAACSRCCAASSCLACSLSATCSRRRSRCSSALLAGLPRTASLSLSSSRSSSAARRTCGRGWFQQAGEAVLGRVCGGTHVAGRIQAGRGGHSSSGGTLTCPQAEVLAQLRATRRRQRLRVRQALGRAFAGAVLRQPLPQLVEFCMLPAPRLSLQADLQAQGRRRGSTQGTGSAVASCVRCRGRRCCLRTASHPPAGSSAVWLCSTRPAALRPSDACGRPAHARQPAGWHKRRLAGWLSECANLGWPCPHPPLGR